MKRRLVLSTPHGDLYGDLELPPTPRALVLIARIRHITDNDVIAASLLECDCAILNMELLSAHELQFVDATQNIPRLTQRLLAILDLVRDDGDTGDLPLALLTADDVTPAAIRVAARRDMQVRALVCRGGLVDRAGLHALKFLTTPLLMLFADNDDLGRAAFDRVRPYLTVARESRTLAADADASPVITDWVENYLYLSDEG
jgi:hypothetical protein